MTILIIPTTTSRIDQICHNADKTSKCHTIIYKLQKKSRELNSKLSNKMEGHKEREVKLLSSIRTESIQNQKDLKRLQEERKLLERQYKQSGDSIMLLAEALFPRDNKAVESYRQRLEGLQ